jgi:hypothetical protein
MNGECLGVYVDNPKQDMELKEKNQKTVKDRNDPCGFLTWNYHVMDFIN